MHKEASLWIELIEINKMILSRNCRNKLKFQCIENIYYLNNHVKKLPCKIQMKTSLRTVAKQTDQHPWNDSTIKLNKLKPTMNVIYAFMA